MVDTLELEGPGQWLMWIWDPGYRETMLYPAETLLMGEVFL